MKFFPELREACAVNASVLGAAFLSGREAATFFATAGSASWAGILAAAILFGTLMGMLCRFSRETGAHTLPGIYYAKLDERCGDSISIVHGLMMVMTGAVALTTAGELGLLSLEMRHPALIAGAATLLLAIMLTLRSMRPLAAMGTVCIPVCAVFFAALALDGRNADTTGLIHDKITGISGNIPAAIFMGMLFACFKAASAGGVAAARAGKLSPMRFGICCGGIMLVITACANMALQRAGAAVWSLNLPMVVLASRWGAAGYYISVYVMWLGCVCTLACALGSVSALMPKRMPRAAACLISEGAVCLMSATGLRALVSTGYPMLGWISALCLGALSIFYERKARVRHIISY